jgi:hypothetical protein
MGIASAGLPSIYAPEFCYYLDVTPAISSRMKLLIRFASSADELLELLGWLLE